MLEKLPPWATEMLESRGLNIEEILDHPTAIVNSGRQFKPDLPAFPIQDPCHVSQTRLLLFVASCLTFVLSYICVVLYWCCLIFV